MARDFNIVAMDIQAFRRDNFKAFISNIYDDTFVMSVGKILKSLAIQCPVCLGHMTYLFNFTNVYGAEFKKTYESDIFHRKITLFYRSDYINSIFFFYFYFALLAIVEIEWLM